MKRVLAVYETARKYCLAHQADMAASFIAATKLPKAVVALQLNERTDITNGHIGAAQRDSILQAGFALQKAGVIPASVDVKKEVDDLIDNNYV